MRKVHGVEVQVVVFWVVTSSSDIIRYKRFEGPCCLRLQSEVFVLAKFSNPSIKSGYDYIRAVAQPPQQRTVCIGMCSGPRIELLKFRAK